MRKLTISSFLLLFCLAKFSYSQNKTTFQGVVQSEQNTPLISASILLKDSSKTKTLAYGITDNQGFYSIEIDYFTSVVLSVRSMGYQAASKSIAIPKKNILPIVQNFYLKVAPTLLKEVELKGDKLPIQVKGDTTSYAVEKFIDGSEEVVEDVLKKLPGVTVEEDGKLKYKNKPISKVLLEGDDLFDKKYQIATQNIDAAAVKGVQAIENYQENKNLQGLEETDEQVLNITLKEDAKNQFYTSTKLGYGYKNRYRGSGTATNITKKNKVFLTINANNIGESLSYFGTISQNSEGVMNQSTPLINVSPAFPNIKRRRVQINQDIGGSANVIIRPTSNLKVKAVLSLINKKNTYEQSSQQNISISNQVIRIDENQKFDQKKSHIEARINLDWDVQEGAALSYSNQFNFSHYQSESNQQASSGSFEESLQGENIYLYQGLRYTYRMDDTRAFVINSNHLYDQQPQEYFLLPAPQSSFIPAISSTSQSNGAFQRSNIPANNFSFSGKYLSSYNTGNYNLFINYSLEDKGLESGFSFKNNNDDTQ